MELTSFLGMLLLLSSTMIQGGPTRHLFFVFSGFVLFNLSMEMVPNSTIYILPAEPFPTRIRATRVSFAAARAKIGATLGVFVIPIIKAKPSASAALVLMSIVSGLGLFFTWKFRIEGHQRTLEGLHSADLP